MNLKRLSDKIKNDNKAKLLLCAAIVIVLVLTLIVVPKIREAILRNRYQEMSAEYNAEVEKYNGHTTQYNSLIGKLATLEIDELPGTVLQKKELYDSFDIYIAKDKKLEGLSEELEKIKKSNEEIVQKFDGLAIDAYNDAAENYNVMADAFNDIAQKTSCAYPG